MKWVLLFYICSCLCEELSFKKGEFSPKKIREQKVVFFDTLQKAEMETIKLKFGFTSADTYVPEGSFICSEIEIFEVKKST